MPKPWLSSSVAVAQVSRALVPWRSARKAVSTTGSGLVTSPSVRRAALPTLVLRATELVPVLLPPRFCQVAPTFSERK